MRRRSPIAQAQGGGVLGAVDQSIAVGVSVERATYSFVDLSVAVVISCIADFSSCRIDSVVAIVFALLILYTGYKIIRSSVAGMMDEADVELLEKMVLLLNENRKENWVDLHNLRIIKYGPMIHLDCHLTVPWYLNVHEAHNEVESLSKLVKSHFGESVELFVHSDGCLDFSCKICDKKDCTKRIHSFEKKIKWSMQNISSDNKHQI